MDRLSILPPDPVLRNYRVKTAIGASAPIHPQTGRPADGYFPTDHHWIWQWINRTDRGRVHTPADRSDRAAKRRQLLADETMVFSLSEAAVALGVCEKTLRRMVKQGKLSAAKVGSGSGQWRIKLSDLKVLLPPSKQEVPHETTD